MHRTGPARADAVKKKNYQLNVTLSNIKKTMFNLTKKIEHPSNRVGTALIKRIDQNLDNNLQFLIDCGECNQILVKHLGEKVANLCEVFEIEAVQTCRNVVDLEKCCKMTIQLRKPASIQPRTTLHMHLLLIFAHLEILEYEYHDV